MSKRRRSAPPTFTASVEKQLPPDAFLSRSVTSSHDVAREEFFGATTPTSRLEDSPTATASKTLIRSPAAIATSPTSVVKEQTEAHPPELTGAGTTSSSISTAQDEMREGPKEGWPAVVDRLVAHHFDDVPITLVIVGCALFIAYLGAQDNAAGHLSDANGLYWFVVKALSCVSACSWFVFVLSFLTKRYSVTRKLVVAGIAAIVGIATCVTAILMAGQGSNGSNPVVVHSADTKGDTQPNTPKTDPITSRDE